MFPTDRNISISIRLEDEDADVVIDSDTEEITSSCVSGIEDEDEDGHEPQQRENRMEGQIIHQGLIIRQTS